MLVFRNYIMIEINTKIIINSDIKKVWNFISAIQRDPSFWKGMTRVRNKSREGNMIIREITFTNSEKCYQKLFLFPMEGIHTRWTSGFLRGIKDIMITAMGNQTLVEIEMRYTLHGITQIRSKSIAEELRNEAKLALQLIKEDIEKIQPFPLDKRTHWADMLHE